MQTEVERQLQRAGLPVVSSQAPDTPPDVAVFTVSVTALRHTGGLYAYAVDVAVYQAAALLRDPTPRSVATWGVGSIGLVEATDLRAILTAVRQNVAQFIQAYRAVHPRANTGGGSTARHAPACARCKSVYMRWVFRLALWMGSLARRRVRRSVPINNARGYGSRARLTDRP
jgi:hypothetical protein